MRKKIFSFLLALCLVIPTALGLVGCGSPETAMVFFRLNDYQATTKATYKDAFWTRNRMDKSESSGVGIITAPEFDAINSFAPLPEEISNPVFETTGEMVFAGWYFDEACTPGMQFNEENWDREYAKKKEQDSSPDLYAKWIKATDSMITFNINNSKVDFTDAYKSANGNLTHRCPSFIFTPDTLATEFAKFPTKDNMKNSTEFVIGDWYLSPDFDETSKLTQEKIAELQGKGQHFFQAYLKLRAYAPMQVYFRFHGCLLKKSGYSNANLKDADPNGELTNALVLDINKDTTWAYIEENLPTSDDIIQDTKQKVIEGFYVNEVDADRNYVYNTKMTEAKFNELLEAATKKAATQYELEKTPVWIFINVKTDFVPNPSK